MELLYKGHTGTLDSLIVIASILVPRVTVYDVTVREGNSDITVNVKFNRTGGDLSTRTRIFADTVQVDGMFQVLLLK